MIAGLAFQIGDKYGRALEMAQLHKQKNDDSNMNAGSLSTSSGVPNKNPAGSFAEIGGLQGSFGRASVENAPYFAGWMARLQAGQQGGQQPGQPSERPSA